MKPGQFIKLLALLLFSTACINNNHGENTKETNDTETSILIKPSLVDTFVPGQIYTNVVCQSDATQSYALYIPSHSQKEPLAIIYFFDPHGDGALPLVKYQALAERYHFILAGSNNSKNANEWFATENIWNTLFNDTKNRLEVNKNRIYLCGFSGGAKVATYIALHHHEIKGVIANGAVLNDIAQAGNINFSFTAITGEGDMNMTDLIAATNGLDQTKARHRIIFFNGIHEWAPVAAMNKAFTGWQLDAMQGNLISANQAFINNYLSQSKKIITHDLLSHNYLKAEIESKLAISMLNGLTHEVDWFIEKTALIKNNPAYKKQWQANQILFAKEQNIKAGFEQQFQQGDITYWDKTIKEVHLKAMNKTATGAMYQRLNAFLSLAFYSISNQLIASDKNDAARYFVDLYQKTDPGNSEAWYFSAILNARAHNAKAAEDDLLKAVKNGFTDTSRLRHQPEFKNSISQNNLSAIERRMENGGVGK